MQRQNRNPTHPEKFAELLDSRYRIPGTDIRFGIDPLLGLLPGAGDWLGGAIALYLPFLAAVRGGSAAVLGRMFINIFMDLLVGTIPVAGELFDIYWKANERNVRILDELERDPDRTTSDSRFWVWAVFVQLTALVVGFLLLVGWMIVELLGLLFG